MPVFVFRLQAWLDQKLQLEKEARIALLDKQRLLQKEHDALLRLTEKEKRIELQLIQIQKELLTKAAVHRAADIERRNAYLKGTSQDLAAAHGETLVQRFAVEEAEAAVTSARDHALACSREVEKIEKYRDELHKRFLKEETKKEEQEQDELGTVMYLNRKGDV